MENHVNNLVRGTIGNFKSNSLNDLIDNPIDYQHTKNIKLSFNKNYSLHHYLLISGCKNENHLGKTFKIIKSDTNSSFFKKLYRLTNENKSIPLMKHTMVNGDYFWTKVHFSLINANQINFNIDQYIFSDKQVIKLTKLIDILTSLEANSGIATSEKYLVGFLEERGIKTFNEYVNLVNC